MTDTSPGMPPLPRIAAEPEPLPVWRADPHRWRRHPNRVVAALLVLALLFAVTWTVVDLVTATMLTLCAGVLLFFLTIPFWTADNTERLDAQRQQLRDLEARVAMNESQAGADHMALQDLSRTVRNQRLDEVAAKRAQRQGVPGQRAGEGS
ncbi:hypothetical protein EV383_4432 [Pseudonocardia sediminis]|uniref:Uncharacterized protein n=1 Tax=Pseudonocardia sediminis TaxID=1397368 RepID=A0A4Q7UZC7_PSEST|nr:hypothetical protein [Pseudonocardia sediminis]RZT87507.1 hypothetical protein EV383_4432 [Pseudonocardia sediminis]